ncbi:MAG: baseplate J/gp47 family protein [Methanoregula sp.]|nr:baseplate J/gp47 family protein [Methanoregula sp.]
MTDYGVTDAGFVKKTYDDILDDECSQAKTYFGPTVNLSETSPLYQFICSEAAEKATLWDLAEQVYYAGFVPTATGANLDACVALLGLARKPATQATGSVIFSRSTTATYDITIPAGTIVQTATGIQFETTAAVTLAAGQTSVSAAIEAVDPGASGNAAAYKITSIPTTISGIESVSNPSAAVDGSDTETDTALRLRALNYSPGAKATLAAIQTAIKALAGVTACLVTEDTTAHTILATVLGGTDAAVNAVIEDTRPAGIACTLKRPDSMTVVVTAAVVMTSGSVAATVQANILAALTKYFGTLTISSDVPYSSVVSAILGSDGVASLTSLSIVCGTTTLSAFGQTLAISDTEVAVEGSHAITVS